MTEPPDFSNLPLARISCRIQETLFTLNPGETLSFLILDPDRCRGRYAGEKITLNGQSYRCRSWRAWNALAESLECRLLTPKPFDEIRLLLRLEKLEPSRSFHQQNDSGKYEGGGTFQRIDKNEEPGFLYYYQKALKRLGISQRKRILDLGIHEGRELEPVRTLANRSFEEMEIVGIDRAESALRRAQELWPNVLRTYTHDLNDLASLELGRFDLILSIGTLQSPGIELKPLIMRLVQEHLNPDGALLLGWPNSRWIDGELLYGARPKHYPFSELSLVIKDLFWIKKYLQQHKFRVVITGREYLFLEATKIGLAR